MTLSERPWGASPPRTDRRTPDGLPVVSLDVAELERDPWPVWARMRKESPVAFVPELHSCVVTRAQDVIRVTTDADLFSARVTDSPLSRTIGPNLLNDDGPDHQRLRRLASGQLRPRQLRLHHEVALRLRARALLDQRPQDVVADVALPLAAWFLEELVGLPPLPVDVLTRWADGIGVGASNFERDPEKAATGARASSEIDGVVDSAAPPEGTLIGDLRAAGCSQSEVHSTVKLFVIGGLQEPRDLLGLALVGLRESGSLDRVADDIALVPKAVEEAARWGSPVGTVTRVATGPVTLSGVDLEAGTPVAAVLASANRDHDLWSDPDRFDLDREGGSHLAFAAGAHACIGAAASRFLVRIALEELLPLRPEVGVAELSGYEFRGPRSLPIALRSEAPG